jgi:hypothetical protein
MFLRQTSYNIINQCTATSNIDPNTQISTDYRNTDSAVRETSSTVNSDLKLPLDVYQGRSESSCR